MDRLSLLSEKVHKIHLVNKLDQLCRVRLQGESSLKVSFNDTGDRCVAILQQIIWDWDSRGERFDFSIVVIGVLSCETISLEERNQALYEKIYDMLFPFVQTQCSSIFVGTGLPTLFLKKENLVFNRNEVNLAHIERNPNGGSQLNLLS